MVRRSLIATAFAALIGVAVWLWHGRGAPTASKPAAAPAQPTGATREAGAVRLRPGPSLPATPTAAPTPTDHDPGTGSDSPTRPGSSSSEPASVGAGAAPSGSQIRTAERFANAAIDANAQVNERAISERLGKLASQVECRQALCRILLAVDADQEMNAISQLEDDQRGLVGVASSIEISRDEAGRLLVFAHVAASR